MHDREILFLGLIIKIKFLVIMHVLRPQSSKIKVLMVDLCAYESAVSTIQKQIITGNSNLVFYIDRIQVRYLKLFMKIGRLVCK